MKGGYSSGWPLGGVCALKNNLRFLVFLLFALSLAEAQKKKACRSAVIQLEAGMISIPRYPKIAKIFVSRLKEEFSNLLPPRVVYFLEALFGVYSETQNMEAIEFEERYTVLDAVKQLNHRQRLEFFTLLKNHPLLHEKSSPGLEEQYTAQAPHALSDDEKSKLLRTLSLFDLPDFDGIMLSTEIIRREHLIGKYRVYFNGGNVEGEYQLTLFNELFYQLKLEDKVIAEGTWQLNGRNIVLEKSDGYVITLQNISVSEMRDGRAQVARLQEAGPIGYMYIELESDTPYGLE